MIQWTRIFLILSFGLLSACGGTGDRTRVSASRTQQQFAKERAEIIERLVPEDGRIIRRKLNTIREAITTVSKIPDIDIPEDAFKVRQVLNQRSLRDLQQIESIVSEAERKRE